MVTHSLLRLPEELHNSIVATNVLRHKDLYQLCAVSWAFHAIYKWHLYRKFCIRASHGESFKYVLDSALKNTPALIQTIRSISLVGAYPGQPYTAEISDFLESFTAELLHKLIIFIVSLPNLEELKLNHFYIEDEYTRSHFFSSIFNSPNSGHLKCFAMEDGVNCRLLLTGVLNIAFRVLELPREPHRNRMYGDCNEYREPGQDEGTG